MTDKDIVQKYLGIPYLHQGRTLDGLDCYGLILAIYKDAGIELFDIDEDYTTDWSWKGRNLFIENAYKEWQQVDKPKFLDIIGFENSKGIVNHAGVVLDENRFIHTCRAGTVVSRILDLNKHKLNGFYRHRDIWLS